MQTQRAFEAGLRGLRDSLTTRLDEVEVAQTGATLAYQSWAVAVGKTGAADGAVMEVPPEDTGTHGQATSGGYDGTTVSNAGRYRWVAAWSRWLWISAGAPSRPEFAAHEAATDAHGLGALTADYPLSAPAIVDMAWVSGRSILDFATSPSQRSGLLAGSVAVGAVWSDVVSAAGEGLTDIVIPRGTFESADDEVLANTGFAVLGRGEASVVRKNGKGSAFRTAVHAAPVISGGRLDADVGYGAMSVTLQSGLGAGFSVGQVVIVLDEGFEVVTGAPKRAEFACIQAIVGDVVTFWGPLNNSYEVSKFARLVPAPLTSKVEYRDFTILGDPTVETADTTENFPALLSVQWALRPIVSGMRFRSAGTSQILLFGSVDASISRCSFTDGGSATTATSDPTSTEGQYGFSYGVCEAGINQGTIVSACHARRIRHLYTTVSVASAVWDNAGSVYGGPQGSKIVGCVASEMKNAAYDTHACGADISFEACRALNSHFVGFQIRSRRTQVINCQVDHAVGCAVWIRGGSAATTQGDDCSVRGLHATRTNLGVTFDAADWREYGAIMDEGVGTKIDGVDARDCGGGLIYAGRNGVAGGARYQGLAATNMALKAATEKSVVKIAGITTGKTVSIGGLYSTSTGEVGHLVDVSAAAGTVALYGLAGTGHTGAAVNVTGGATVTQQRVDEQAAQPTSRGHIFTDRVDVKADAYFARSGVPAQYSRIYFDGSGGRHYWYNDPASVKPIIYYATTNEAGTARTDPSNKNGFQWYVNVSGVATKRLHINEDGVGFYTTAPVAKQTVSGSRGSNAALASLLTALAALGLITDSTS